MIIENKLRFKVNDIDLSNNINKKINLNQENDIKSSTKKKDINIKNDINNQIKIRSNIINQGEKEIQENISLIQMQEVKIDEMEKILKQAKTSYLQAQINENEEEVKQKIKIRQLAKTVDELEEKNGEKNQNLNNEIKYIDDKENVVKVINDTLMKINNVKFEISKYKSKLFSLEEAIKKGKLELYRKEDYIKEEFIVNPIDFIFIQGDIKTGIIINVLV